MPTYSSPSTLQSKPHIPSVIIFSKTQCILLCSTNLPKFLIKNIFSSILHYQSQKYHDSIGYEQKWLINFFNFTKLIQYD